MLYHKNKSSSVSLKQSVYYVPIEKGIMSSLPTTLPNWSRNLSGLNCSGSFQTFGSICTLYRFGITYKTLMLKCLVKCRPYCTDKQEVHQKMR